MELTKEEITKKMLNNASTGREKLFFHTNMNILVSLVDSF